MLSSKVVRTLERYGMIRSGDGVLVGLSGGADSVALTYVLLELKERLGIALFLAHLNHGLRADAEEDETFCRSLAERLGLPFASDRVDVAGQARLRKRSIEDEGRSARYRFLETQARRFGARKIAMGHTLDDQAETFLLRLLRGSGGRGLGAIHPVRESSTRAERERSESRSESRGGGAPRHWEESSTRAERERPAFAELRRVRRSPKGGGGSESRSESRGGGAPRHWEKSAIIRPLIDARRAEIEAYLGARGIRFLEDASNADPRFTRNRIRHQELPRLSSTYNPRLSETLARSASLLRDEEEWMEAETREAFGALAEVSEDEIHLERKGLSRRPLALRRRLVRAAIGGLRGLENVSHRHVEDVLNLAERGRSGRELHLPGLVVEICFDRVRFRGGASGRERNERERGYNGFEYRLSIPARVRIPECSGTLSARIAGPDREPPDGRVDTPPFGDAVVLGIGAGFKELKVRSPRPGDRFRPLGAPGSKPLSRYLMERKISREMRPRVALVVRGDSKEEILWVVGHGVSEASRVTPGSPRLSLRWVTP